MLFSDATFTMSMMILFVAYSMVCYAMLCLTYWYLFVTPSAVNVNQKVICIHLFVLVANYTIMSINSIPILCSCLASQSCPVKDLNFASAVF